MKVHSLFPIVAVLIFGCSSDGNNGERPDGGTQDVGVDSQRNDTSDANDDAATNDASETKCPSLPAMVEYTTLEGFSGSEDFTFDSDGNVVSVQDGNLTRRAIGGSPSLVASGFGDTAGIRILADGDFVLANVEKGELTRITAAGGQSTILSGIAYPNGVEVDSDGVVYVAEHDAGRVRQVNANSGEFTIIATEIRNPNGLYLSPDEQTLYIGSFWGGTLHSVSRDGDGWGPTTLVAQVSEPTETGGSCESEGEDCRVSPTLSGKCTADFICGVSPIDCNTVGEECTNALGAKTTCRADSTGALVCPTVPANQLDACEGRAEFDSCEVAGLNGDCAMTSPESGSGLILACSTQNGVCAGVPTNTACIEFGLVSTCQNDDFGAICGGFGDEDACDGLSAGDQCESGFGRGICTDGRDIGFEGLLCNPSQSGGLDGVNVDECGNIYMSEFTTGNIYRITPDGEKVETIVTLPSSWVPNMHWGLGVGGFEPDKLYVMDRDEGRLFALEVGVKSSLSQRTGGQ